MVFRNRPIGYLGAFGRMGAAGEFTDEDERLLQAFAASAATAVTTARIASAAAVRVECCDTTPSALAFACAAAGPSSAVADIGCPSLCAGLGTGDAALRSPSPPSGREPVGRSARQAGLPTLHIVQLCSEVGNRQAEPSRNRALR